MTESDDIKYMRRCIDLAAAGAGATYPNPLVGSVIVCESEIIGEGFHMKAGMPHAEVNAVNSVRKRELLSKSTLYVNLEPCSHFGRTPPCADMIISNSIPRVVIGNVDPSGKVAGKGIARLRNAGIEVVEGVAEEECRWLNRRFITLHLRKRPYIILKWAASADGYLDAVRVPGQTGPNWITGKAERVLVHKWRAEEEAILAGANTFRTDAPKLNVRDWTGLSPLRIIVSSSGNVDVAEAGDTTGNRTVIFTHNKNISFPHADAFHLDQNESTAVQITDYLFRQGIQSFIVEGGAEVLNHFISSGLWDEARIFEGSQYFRGGVRAPLINGVHIEETKFRSSRLNIYLNSESVIYKHSLI